MCHFVKNCAIFEWWCCPQNKIPLDYIYRQAVLLRGGSLVPPAKGWKFVERKRKEMKKRREENRKHRLEKKKGKEREEK